MSRPADLPAFLLPPPERPLWVVGDVHGAHDKLRALLIRAGLIDRQGQWTGEQAQLVFLGDYLDRGPDGIGVIRLVRGLEEQARMHGAEVTALLGNHEVMFLAAAHFREQDPQDRLGFREYWLGNGGRLADLERLSDEDDAWLRARPALARMGDWLLAHADSLFYLGLGQTVAEVNRQVTQLLNSPEADHWGAFVNAFVDRLNFAGRDGASQVRQLLTRYGGQRLVHGHTPTHLLLHASTQNLPGDPNLPLVYAGGLSVAVDSGMAYFPGAGFMAQLGEVTRGEPPVQRTVALPAGLFGSPFH